MSRRIIKSSASTQPAVGRNSAHILTSVEVAQTSPLTPSPPVSDVSVATIGNPTGDSVVQKAPLVWRYKDVDIEVGNRFPYKANDASDSVVDFEVHGKVVKSFLGKDPMYNHNLNVKATAEDVSRIKAIVCTAPNLDASKPSFEWPFEANKEGVFKFVNKENLEDDFAENRQMTDGKAG